MRTRKKKNRVGFSSDAVSGTQDNEPQRALADVLERTVEATNSVEDLLTEKSLAAHKLSKSRVKHFKEQLNRRKTPCGSRTTRRRRWFCPASCSSSTQPVTLGSSYRCFSCLLCSLSGFIWSGEFEKHVLQTEYPVLIPDVCSLNRFAAVWLVCREDNLCRYCECGKISDSFHDRSYE